MLPLCPVSRRQTGQVRQEGCGWWGITELKIKHEGALGAWIKSSKVCYVERAKCRAMCADKKVSINEYTLIGQEHTWKHAGPDARLLEKGDGGGLSCCPLRIIGPCAYTSR